MRFLLTLLVSISLTAAWAQTGTIRGTVFEAETGDPVIAANVVIESLNTGASTDLDGSFTLDVPVGTYTLKISYISFQTLEVQEVEVKEGEVTLFDNLLLQPDNIELVAVVVTAEAVRNTEAALLTLKKKSTVMMDGISSAKIRLIGDATAVEAAKRVTGVSIEGGKYVYVRGLGDRYSKTTLNGLDIPGLDPDKNTIQMDIFPTSLISNIVVSKNFTADMPADFTGGILNIETKAFPEKKIFEVSAGLGFNPSMHLRSDYLRAGGGRTDFLGFDDGTRALPAGARSNNIPTPISGAPQSQVTSFVQSFNPDLDVTQGTSLMDFNMSLSLGNQISLKKGKVAPGDEPKLGYMFSASYKSNTTFYDNVQYGEYQRFADTDENELRYATVQNGQMGERNVLVGLLGGLAYKTKYDKYRFTVMHLQNGESRAAEFNIDNDGEAVGQSGYIAFSDNIEYNQRSLTNVLFNGTHVLENSGWEIDWRVAPTLSISNDPDIRKTAFTFEAVDTSFNAGAGGNPSRIWRSLNEVNVASRLDFQKKYNFKGEEAKLKFGTSYTYKVRDYEILQYEVQFFGNQSWDSPDPATVLDPSNIYPNQPNSIYFQSGNASPNPNAYSSNVSNAGLYVSNEFTPIDKLKAIIGLRAEYFLQRHTGRDQQFASGDPSGNNLVNEPVLNSLDLFPSINFIYAVTENQNLRLGYGRTIARPSFKELSYAQILDPLTNRIFNGSLFTYAAWNGQLSETRIDNIDLRWEMFQDRGEILSASLFYKGFDAPIELVRIPEQQTSTEFQPRNVGRGSLLGIELEFAKRLTFISPQLENFTFNGNVTLIQSQIEMSDVEFNSRKSFERNGETITNTRVMAGQSPYVVNVGLTYNDYTRGLDVGVFYNVKGPTLHIVGVGLYPDVYTVPFHSLNLSVSKRIKDRTSIDFKISNLLNDDLEYVFRSYEATPANFSRLSPGTAFSLGIKHKL